MFSHTNDAVHVFDLIGATGWRQIPARLIYAGAAVGLGLLVVRGYRRTFDRPSTPEPAGRSLVVPLVATGF